MDASVTRKTLPQGGGWPREWGVKPDGWRGVALVLGLLAGGCCPLTPFADIRAALPQREFVEIDGAAVHFKEWGHGERSILLIHGFGQSSHVFHDLGPLLAGKRRVLAPDLRGFGYSERPRGAALYHPAGQAAMLTKFLEMKTRGPVDVVAHSYGCELALRLAAAHPEKIRRLILVSPALNMDIPPDSILRSAVARELLYPFARGLVCDRSRLRGLYERAYFQPDHLSEETMAEYHRQLLVEGLHRAYRGFGSSIERIRDGRVELDEIHQPVLMVAGAGDAITPPETLPAGRLGISVVVLENVGHVAPEEAPRELAREVREFLSMED